MKCSCWLVWCFKPMDFICCVHAYDDVYVSNDAFASYATGNKIKFIRNYNLRKIYFTLARMSFTNNEECTFYYVKFKATNMVVNIIIKWSYMLFFFPSTILSRIVNGKFKNQ